ncbi:MAG: zinc ribbon domain-containing protein [Actinomycetota bacterium]
MDRLLELQELDISIDRLESRKREIESGAEVAESQRRADEIEDRVGTLRLALDSIHREEKRIDHDVGSLDQRIAAEEKRLYDGSVANPKELSSIQAEIANLRKRKSRLEDEELEQMERREEIEGKLPPQEKELAEARDRLAELRVGSERELVEIGSALEGRRAEREGITGEIEGELLDLYEDLRGTKKGVGVAALRDGVCQGCHEKLPALAIDRLKKQQGIRRCENCRRILIIE